MLQAYTLFPLSIHRTGNSLPTLREKARGREREKETETPSGRERILTFDATAVVCIQTQESS
jgi:hypothetical protein